MSKGSGARWLAGGYLVEFCELFVKCCMCFDQRSVRLLIPATREREGKGREGGGKGRDGQGGEGQGGKQMLCEFGEEKLITTARILTSLITVLVPQTFSPSRF